MSARQIKSQLDTESDDAGQKSFNQENIQTRKPKKKYYKQAEKSNHQKKIADSNEERTWKEKL